MIIIRDLQQKAARYLEAAEDPTILGLVENFDVIPNFMEDRIELFLGCSYEDYEFVLEFDKAYLNATHIRTFIEEKFGTTKSGIPIFLSISLVATIPEEDRELLKNLGKIKVTKQEAYEYETISC